MSVKRKVAAGPGRWTNRKRAGLLALAILLATAVAAVGCAKGPGSAKTTEELLTQLQQDRTQIDQTSQTMMQRIEMFNQSRQPGERTLQFSEIFTQDLNPEQRDVLDTLVAQEKDISYRSLLEKIIADRDSIRSLQEKVMHLEQTLPDQFVVAKRGDKQNELAMRYLTVEAKLDEAKAKDLVKQVDVSDELVPGNQVWFFYDPQKDTFRTYVTQGDAGQTPVQLRRAKTKQLVKERDAYKKERDTAKEQVATLESDKTQLQADNSQLHEELVTRQNSLYYHADNDQNLKAQGVLSSFTKKLKDVKGLNYDQSLDLRLEQSIDLDPQAFGLDRIKSVRLLPSIYQEGRDFKVEIDESRSSARLVILDPEVFKGKEVLLAIKS